jgi:hypothetical protein
VIINFILKINKWDDQSLNPDIYNAMSYHDIIFRFNIFVNSLNPGFFWNEIQELLFPLFKLNTNLEFKSKRKPII